MIAFLTRLGLNSRVEESDFAMFKLEDGDQLEIFGPTVESHAHFTTGPVAGFRVENILVASKELEAAGAVLLGPLHREGDSAWQHFRGPDGNVYEINQQMVD